MLSCKKNVKLSPKRGFMAHHIFNVDGIDSLMVVREAAWHGLVYNLYDLSDDEIKLIEDNVK